MSETPRNNSLIGQVLFATNAYIVAYYGGVAFIDDQWLALFEFFPKKIGAIVSVFGSGSFLYQIPHSFGGEQTVGFVVISFYHWVLGLLDDQTEHPTSGALLGFSALLVVTLGPKSLDELVIKSIGVGYFMILPIVLTFLGESLFKKTSD